MMLLTVLTVVSMVAAVVASAIAWRFARQARVRSEARVAMLAAALDADQPVEVGPAPPASGPAAAELHVAAPTVAPAGRASTHRERPAPLDEGEIATDPVEVGGMFASAHRSEPRWRLSPGLAIGAVAGLALFGAILAAGGSGTETAPRPAAQPLDLLSLRHTEASGTTTITGLVRNPAGAVPVERATAVVYFFDTGGAFISSGRAPLDFLRLGAGEESPFHVSVPTPPGAVRYRVSFRYAEGGIVPHVDRRAR
jgi:hypothetical protein